MKILNLGSLNIDKVYSVENFVKAGETISSLSLDTFCGGKGLNQSISVRKAGSMVYHGGKIGTDGDILLDKLKEFDVNTDYVLKSDDVSGHAIIQVEKSGQNNIILYGGANQQITKQDVDSILSNFEKDDIILLQNEISNMDYIMDKAYSIGMRIALNPSPMNDKVLSCDLSKVSYFIMNEIEAQAISNEKKPLNAIDVLKQKYPNSKFVITLGGNGVLYYDGSQVYSQGVFDVKVVDTTAAGDTFTGYFLNGVLENKAPQDILYLASKASAICVTQHGAADSIPLKQQVLDTQLNLK